MAQCQKFVRSKSGGAEQCKGKATHLCILPMTYTQFGRIEERTEYRCNIHKEGQTIELRGGSDG